MCIRACVRTCMCTCAYICVCPYIQHVCRKCLLLHEPTLFTSSMVKSESTWLTLRSSKQTQRERERRERERGRERGGGGEEAEQKEEYFYCRTIDRTAIRSLPGEIIAHFCTPTLGQVLVLRPPPPPPSPRLSFKSRSHRSIDYVWKVNGLIND